MTDRIEDNTNFFRHLTPITSLQREIQWNIQNLPPGPVLVDENSLANQSRIEIAINYAHTRNIPQLKTIIQDNTQIRAPTNVNKFGYILMALMGIQRGAVAKTFSNIPFICSSPLRLSALIRMIYHIYEPVLVNNRLPEIPGVQQYMPNMESDVSDMLQTLSTDFPTIVIQQYSIYTSAYLYWATLNTEGNTNHQRLVHPLSSISDMPHRLLDVYAYRRGIQTQEEALTSIFTNNILHPVVRTNNNEARNNNEVRSNNEAPTLPPPAPAPTPAPDPLKHLKETLLTKYATIVSHNIEKPEDCVICLEAMIYDASKPNEIRVTDCGHMFHTTCLNQWRKNICPTCRKPTSRSSLRRTTEALRERRTRERQTQPGGGAAAREFVGRILPNRRLYITQNNRVGAEVIAPEEVRIERMSDIGRRYRPQPYADLDQED